MRPAVSASCGRGGCSRAYDRGRQAARDRVLSARRAEGRTAGEAAGRESRRATAPVDLAVELTSSPSGLFGRTAERVSAGPMKPGTRVLAGVIDGVGTLWTALTVEPDTVTVKSEWLPSGGAGDLRRDSMGLPRSRTSREAPREGPGLPGLTYLGWNEKGFEEYRNDRDGSILVRVPAGEFWMGSEEEDDEKPPHRVQLSEYLIGKYEVTWLQYLRFCERTGRPVPARPAWAGGDHPVVEIGWDDAVAYCAWAGLKLPTEAQWEKAARSADRRRFPWGDDPPDAGGVYRANYWPAKPGRPDVDGFEFSAPVGSFPRGASPYGCQDMAGNAWEYCQDWYALYPVGDAVDPEGAPEGPERVKHGGGWNDRAPFLRSSFRAAWNPLTPYVGKGFRVAR